MARCVGAALSTTIGTRFVIHLASSTDASLVAYAID